MNHRWRFGCGGLFIEFFLILCAGAEPSRELRQGIWASRDMSDLPLAVSGYQVYLLGEMHGARENEQFLEQYLERLTAGGLRDLALEINSVWEPSLQAYAEGRTGSLPEQVCLRTGLLRGVRRLNEKLAADQRVRVHAVDVDSPAAAIHQHMMAIRERVPGGIAVKVPPVSQIRKKGIEATARLKRLTQDLPLLGELRTVEHSIRALKQGLEFGVGPALGSPYLDEREEAIASNIRDIVNTPDCRGILVFFGSDHVSKRMRRDGGANRNRDFAPMALRLEQAGLRVYSVALFPLSGRTRWRSGESELLWTAKDGSLADGESLDRVLAGLAEGTLLYIDPRRQKIRLPSQDVSGYGVDAFLLFGRASPMGNSCGSR
jgi:hypothetical protein